MNSSISTVSGRLKLKMVLLGCQSVGKSCIIERYVNDRFDEGANVTREGFSLQWGSIFWQRRWRLATRRIACRFGTRQDSNGSNLWYRDTLGMRIVHSLSSMSAAEPPSIVLRPGCTSIMIIKLGMDSRSWSAIRSISLNSGRWAIRKGEARLRSWGLCILR